MRKLWGIVALFVVVSTAVEAEITIATWNVRMLSSRSRTDEELSLIADILARYDLVAIQEARDVVVFERLTALLPEYSYVVSEPVGRSVYERYAFLYRHEKIELLGTPFVVPDPHDEFIREPYVASFRAGSFDFTLINVHVVYGRSKAERRAEVSLFDEVVDAVDQANGAEDDVLLLGDFNLDAADSAWQFGSHEPLVPPEVPTTISDASSYDNIWFDAAATPELVPPASIYRFDEELFSDDDAAASLAVSDHRPVFVIARTDGEDDDGGGVFVNALAAEPFAEQGETPQTISTTGAVK